MPNPIPFGPSTRILHAINFYQVEGWYHPACQFATAGQHSADSVFEFVEPASESGGFELWKKF